MSRSPGWPDTSDVPPPVDHAYASATWLLGRHPRLARLAARIHGVVEVQDGHLVIDLEHLAAVINAIPAYLSARDDYERMHPIPAADEDWYRWRESGPQPDTFAEGLADFLVMSSGESAYLRLLATCGSERIPFRIGDLRSLDIEGLRLTRDWGRAISDGYLGR